jgi:hypothetical protein
MTVRDVLPWRQCEVFSVRNFRLERHPERVEANVPLPRTHGTVRPTSSLVLHIGTLRQRPNRA